MRGNDAPHLGAQTMLADDVDSEQDPTLPAPCAPSHPLDGWSSEELERAVSENIEALGSISLGQPNSGRLLNARRLTDGPGWQVVDGAHAWGTSETIDFLTAAVDQVTRLHPGSPVLKIGDLSAEHGGPLCPHVSHQSGRDVDVGYYYLEGSRWYVRASDQSLDVTRTWALVRALVTITDVDLILADRSVIARLRKHALEIGEDAEWVAAVFGGSDRRGAIVRHAPGHATHLHVRFYNPIAQMTGYKTHHLLLDRGIVTLPAEFVFHTARRGDTLGRLARRYNTTIVALREANGLTSTRIVAGRRYKIPRPGRPSSPPVFFPRVLPTEGPGQAAPEGSVGCRAPPVPR